MCRAEDSQIKTTLAGGRIPARVVLTRQRT